MDRGDADVDADDQIPDSEGGAVDSYKFSSTKFYY